MRAIITAETKDKILIRDNNMHLKSIYIKNFKSLLDFQLDFATFNCLIGLNGSGKSTVLQALDFISHLMKGDITQWLRKRDWRVKELHSKLSTYKNISINVSVDISGVLYIWDADFNTTTLRCTTETISSHDAKFLKIEGGKCSILQGDNSYNTFDIIQKHQGSILSSLKSDKIPEILTQIRTFISKITSLDLLSPQSLRLRSRGDGVALGLSGEYFTSFIDKLSFDNRENLVLILKKLYPCLNDIEIKSAQGGWKSLFIKETYGSSNTTTEAKHINDGLLRLMAIFAQIQSHDKDGFLLFDEIENGINPELIEFLVNYLINSNKQTLITTHSPMILNYIPDEEAIKSIQYLYKTQNGETKVIRFFDIPSLKKKLNVMGPGEVFVDTRLSGLVDEIHNLLK